MPNFLSTRRDADVFAFTMVMHDPAAVTGDAARLSELASPFLEEAGVLAGEANAIHTAIEELLTNLGKFGRIGEGAPPPSTPLAADGRVRVTGGTITLEITDNGGRFDPSLLPPPKLPEDPLDLVEGGLGIHMLRRMFTSFRYVREGGRNIGLWELTREGRMRDDR